MQISCQSVKHFHQYIQRFWGAEILYMLAVVEAQCAQSLLALLARSNRFVPIWVFCVINAYTQMTCIFYQKVYMQIAYIRICIKMINDLA